MTYKANRLKPRGKELRARERKNQQLCRERKAEREEAEEFGLKADIFLSNVKHNGFCLFGEVSPGNNAVTLEEEITLASEYAEALGLPPRGENQNPRNFILETLKAWCKSGAHPFDRTLKIFALDTVYWLSPDDYELPADALPADAPVMEQPNV